MNQQRHTIKKAAPIAEEKISYGIPTLTLNGNLDHIAVHKNHIGSYTGSSPFIVFKKELVGYKTHKCTIQIPLD